MCQPFLATDQLLQPTNRTRAASQFAWLRELLAGSSEPQFVQNGNGQLQLANAAYATLPAAIASQLLGAGQSEESVEIVACPLPNGSTHWYQLTRQPVPGPAGEAWRLVTAHDTTPLHHAREAAQQTTRTQEAFLATVSHEIRTPLNGIIGLARRLQQPTSLADQTTYLGHILASAEGLLTVVNGLLDFTKLEAGQLAFEAQPFEVAAVVQAAAATVAPDAQTKHLALRVQLPADPLPVVVGDAHRLRQVLLNLLGNAVKFTAVGEVSVAVQALRYEQGQVHLQFCVADTGIGMEADQLETVFQPFAQASAATTRLYGGTGLGLAICRRLVERQGGRIWLDSQPGRGSRFFVELPLPVSDQLPVPAIAAPATPGLLSGLRVLLVEDNPVNTLLATALLHSWQTHTDHATNGEQALTLARCNPYDVLLMDIQLPLLSGLEVTARLRAAPGPNQHAPIVALTAGTLPAEAATYAAAGFTDWLLKPYHENSLYLLLARHTGRAPQPAQPAPAGASVPTPAYGFNRLGKLARDVTFIHKMQRLFVDTVPGELAQLEDAIAARSWTGAQRLSHTLKSTYGILQIDEGLRYLRKIEENLRNKPTAGALENLMRPLRQITQQLVEEFEKNPE